MSEQSAGPLVQPALDFWHLTLPELEGIDLGVATEWKVYIPLPSFNVTNSHIDICSDLIEAIWVAESLAKFSESAEVAFDYPKHWVRLELRLRRPKEGLKETLTDCLRLFTDIDDDDESGRNAWGVVRDKVLEFEDGLPGYLARFPDLVDHYYGNLVEGAYQEYRSEAPDYYREEIGKHPERQIGYFKSAQSARLGGDCYASSDCWVLPNHLDLDKFFAETRQKYRMCEFVIAHIFTLHGRSFVQAEGLVTFFPMHNYFKSRACVHLSRSDEDDGWLYSLLWDNASFSHSPFLEAIRGEPPADLSLPPTKGERCLVHESGTLILVDDSQYHHILYDTKPLNLAQLKALHGAASLISQNLAKSAGLADSITCDWASISDEQFEQLCYDLIYAHPKFDSERINKLGKSRSRDGGRDIVAYELAKPIGGRPKKWIFQCKLVTGGASLSAAKLVDVGDMLEVHEADGFGVMTNALIDATLFDKLTSICDKRQVEQLHFSLLEIERALGRHPGIRNRYFQDESA